MRTRLVVDRRGLGYWAGAVAVALLAGGLVQRSMAGAAELRSRFGGLRSVPVVARAVSPGHTLTNRDIETRQLPAGLLSHDIAANPIGHAALVALVPGEVVVRSRLAPYGLTGAAALVPRGMRAIALPGGPAGRPPVHPGDAVDVLATTTGDAASTTLVARNAIVIAVDRDTDAVTVAVPADQAAALAAAVTTAALTIALA